MSIRSIISDAKKTAQSDFAPPKKEAPFKNTPQWESGLVSI